MAASRYNFDIQIRRGGRWLIETTVEREAEARRLANEYFAQSKCAGVRIMRNWTRPDATVVETEIFCEVREVKDDGPVRISQGGPPPAFCSNLRDYFAYNARQAMARIFHTYLEKSFLTPTEVIHDLRELKRIQDKDALVQTAVDWVASIQTRESERDVKERRGEIFDAVDQMFERARTLDKSRLPVLKGKFSEVMRALGPDVDPEERNYLMLAALSRDLINLRSWLSKLELLCQLAAAESDADALQLIDGVMADVLSTDVIQEILGLQPSLGSTICALLDLADGTLVTNKTNESEITATLTRLLGESRLPASRRCIIDRAHRALRLASPLHPRDPAQEPEEFRKVIARVLTRDGLYSGAETAQALTTRFTRMVEQGGRAGRRAAISGVFNAMPDRARGVIYLCDLARSDLAKDHLDDMIELFDQVLTAQTLSEFCGRGLPANERMSRASRSHRAMAASPFPPELRQKIAGHIDGLLERFVVEEKIIERLHQTGSNLRDRAVRLVRFCGSGMLPEGKALAKAQTHTLTLLRQPDFSARFVDGIEDPVVAQKALRDFFHLMKNTPGFSG